MKEVKVTLKRIPSPSDLKLVGFSSRDTDAGFIQDLELINADIMPSCNGNTIVEYDDKGCDVKSSKSQPIIWIGNWYLPAYFFNITDD